MKKVYEIKRHQLKNIEVAIDLGRVLQSRDFIETHRRRIDEDKKLTADNRKKINKELDEINESNTKFFYNSIRKLIKTKNLISIRTNFEKDLIEVYEYDHIAGSKIFQPSIDKEGKYYIEIED